MSNSALNNSACPPPIAQLVRMTQMKREILSTSQTEINSIPADAITDAIYGPICFETENIRRAELAARIILDPVIAQKMSPLFERYRNSF